MTSWSRWVGVGVAAGIVAALVPVVRGNVDLRTALQKTSAEGTPAEPGSSKSGLPDLTGIDLLRLKMRPRRVTTPLSDGRTAELTLDPQLQRAAIATMKKYRVPEAGLVLTEVKTGKILAYASHVQTGAKFDVNVRAEPPAASLFKVVTASALVEVGGLNAKTEQCYRGGRSGISASELQDDPARDKWCATLDAALGRSLNVVFGKLAQKHLTPEDLRAMAGAYGFGQSVPFLVPNDPLKLEIPDEPLAFARTSAGFWNTSLSPLAAAVIAQTVANGGVALRPWMLRRVYKGKEVLWKASRQPRVLRRTIRPETAKEVTTMMVQTVHNGSAFKQFHDRRGRPFIPGVRIAGKTGTLTRHKANRHYTWFIGFAPAENPEVAVSALVVNTPLWQIKGPILAREVLKTYFARKGRASAK